METVPILSSRRLDLEKDYGYYCEARICAASLVLSGEIQEKPCLWSPPLPPQPLETLLDQQVEVEGTLKYRLPFAIDHGLFLQAGHCGSEEHDPRHAIED